MAPGLFFLPQQYIVHHFQHPLLRLVQMPDDLPLQLPPVPRRFVLRPASGFGIVESGIIISYHFPQDAHGVEISVGVLQASSVPVFFVFPQHRRRGFRQYPQLCHMQPPKKEIREGSGRAAKL